MNVNSALEVIKILNYYYYYYYYYYQKSTLVDYRFFKRKRKENNLTHGPFIHENKFCGKVQHNILLFLLSPSLNNHSF